MAPVEFHVEEREIETIPLYSPIVYKKILEELPTENGLNNHIAPFQKKEIQPTEAELLLEEKLKNRKQKIIWRNVFLIAAIHASAVYGLIFCLSQIQLKTLLFTTIYGIVCGLGVTAGAHRFYTHKSFKAKKPLEILLLLLYSMAGLNPMFEWVRDHRVHHKFSETDADPHNANRGFFFAHCGWLMMTKHPEVLRKGAKVDMSDITSNPLVQFHQKYYVPLFFFFVLIFPMALPMMLWEETLFNSFISCLTRYCFVLNSVWLVNSAAHLYGNKPYDDKIMPTQCWWVSIFALGEGWHNYHHVFPWDYKCDELGLKINLTTRFLNACAKIGWAYDLKVASDPLIKTTAENHGDNSHPIYKRKLD